MKIPVEIKLKQINIEEMMINHKEEEVIGYCKNCSNYNKNHACPDFDFDLHSFLSRFNYVTLVLTEIKLEDPEAVIDALTIEQLNSKVFDAYVKDNKAVKRDKGIALSMRLFNDVKDKVGNKLLNLEKMYMCTLSSPPGTCTKCKVCTKIIGEECVSENELRYSLEALGFLVSGIYKKQFNIEMVWNKGEIPKTYHTLSGLFSKDKIDIDGLTKLMPVGTLDVTIDE